MSENAPHPLIELARQSIISKIQGTEFVVPPNLDSEFETPSGVFVTLKKAGRLRGCIGSLTPKTGTLAREVAHNARLAAFKDPRFDSVSREELDQLSIQIEVVTPPVPVENPGELDPAVDGLVVKCGKKQGVLLPGLEGVNTVDQQIAICREKANIGKNEPLRYSTFRVRHIT